ncbi:MAG: cyclase family protein [Patescibacteria group bacterium]
MARYFDISLPIEDGMLSWPSDPDVRLEPAKNVTDHGSNVTRLGSGTHLGTHIDAPRHFFDDGAGVDAFPPEQLIGPAVLVDVTGAPGETIAVSDLKGAVPDGTERVLLKTKNTERGLLRQPFTKDYVALSGEAAGWLAGCGVRVVGIDYLSIQKRGDDRTPHTALLERGAVIIEGLYLEDVPAGEYELIALPLRIKDGDGAPARVLLKA